VFSLAVSKCLVSQHIPTGLRVGVSCTEW